MELFKILIISIISIFIFQSQVIGQSSKYKSVGHCVLQTMEERKLTGNDMFEMVKEECERILGNSNNKGKKKKGVLYYHWLDGKDQWLDYGKDDDKYVGEIKNGLPDGIGTRITPHKNNYFGEWKKGIRNGQGTTFFSNGYVTVGEFYMNSPWNAKSYDNFGKITEKYVNGKMIKQ